MFGEYFALAGEAASQAIFVGANRFPVRDVFLEVCATTPFLLLFFAKTRDRRSVRPALQVHVQCG